MPVQKILIYGYGNPGRQDDGLGILFADAIQEFAVSNNWSHIRTETNYQLNIEDAAEISDEDLVIFADASMETIDRFRYDKLEPSDQENFTMHAVHPAYVLFLCHSIYGRTPRAMLMHIRGEEWEFREGLSEKARENLSAAIGFIVNSGELNPQE